MSNLALPEGMLAPPLASLVAWAGEWSHPLPGQHGRAGPGGVDAGKLVLSCVHHPSSSPELGDSINESGPCTSPGQC